MRSVDQVEVEVALVTVARGFGSGCTTTLDVTGFRFNAGKLRELVSLIYRWCWHSSKSCYQIEDLCSATSITNVTTRLACASQAHTLQACVLMIQQTDSTTAIGASEPFAFALGMQTLPAKLATFEAKAAP